MPPKVVKEIDKLEIELRQIQLRAQLSVLSVNSLTCVLCFETVEHAIRLTNAIVTYN